MELNKINQNIKYQGYLWPSNEKKPIVCNGQKSLKDEIEAYYSAENRKKYDILNSKNPFVVEGYLFANNTSYTIKFVDGISRVETYNEFDKPIEGVVIEKKEFCSHRMDGRKLHFLQYWRARKDKTGKEVGDIETEGMPVLEPAEIIFVGF